MQVIKNVVARVKPYAKVTAYTVGGLAVAGGAYLAYNALKGVGAEAAAEVVSDAASTVADAATAAVDAALRG